jgi:hypothetical protein
MGVVLKDLIGTKAWVYLDDVIIYSKTIEEHTKRLEHVLDRFDRANLQLQPSKCVFAQPEVKYLGSIESGEELTACSEKTEVDRRYPTPKSVKQVRAFLGLASFYLRLVPNFADTANPLTELT